MSQEMKMHDGKEYSVIIVPEPREQEIHNHFRSYTTRVLLVSLIEADHLNKRVFDLPFLVGFLQSARTDYIQLVICTRHGLFMHEPVQIPVQAAEDRNYLQTFVENQLFPLLQNYDYDMLRLRADIHLAADLHKR